MPEALAKGSVPELNARKIVITENRLFGKFACLIACSEFTVPHPEHSMSARVSLDPFQLSAHDLAMSSTFHSLDSNMFFTTGTLGYIAPCNSAAAVHWFSRPQLNAFYKTGPLPWRIHLVARWPPTGKAEEKEC